MLFRLNRINTLRNQILTVFLFVMAIVLITVGTMTFSLMSTLLKTNAEKQIQQTAREVNGRMETLYRQLDTLSKQVATDADVQQSLLQVAMGQGATFEQRQALTRIVRRYEVYAEGGSSFDIYTTGRNRLVPLDEGSLTSRIGEEWIERADRAKGAVVWIGADPRDPEFMLAIRRISLMDRWFENGGYLLLRVRSSYFQLDSQLAGAGRENHRMLLVDGSRRPISANFGGELNRIIASSDAALNIEGSDYIVVREASAHTGWLLIILAPVSSLTEGISVLRAALVVSGAVGFLIFLVCSVLLSTMITRPILRLIRTMRSARLGELKPSPVVHSTLEINELTRTYNDMVENTNHLIRMIYEKELVRSRTELKALQAQINPHFLYNTLEALYWALQEKGDEELSAFVVAMSEFFRYTIGHSQQDEWVTMTQELEHVERYMRIMQLRFGQRLLWSISAPDNCGHIRIPKLLIQPLVENAILHGIGNKKQPGSVSVAIEQGAAPGNWLVLVRDDGPGMDEETVRAIVRSLDGGGRLAGEGLGMALVNVNKRLQLYYPDRSGQGLDIRSKPGHGTIVSFEIQGGGGDGAAMHSDCG